MPFSVLRSQQFTLFAGLLIDFDMCVSQSPNGLFTSPMYVVTSAADVVGLV